jgi:TPR repeat protein
MTENVPQNQPNGLAWIKEACKNNHVLATEYKIYYDIRFGNITNLPKLEESLETAANKHKSTRACNTLAEFSMAQQDKSEEFKVKAARYYGQSANAGCLIGMYHLGCYQHKGFGVTQNTDRAIESLTSAEKLGNGQAAFELFLVYCIDGPKKDVVQAYKYCVKACMRGVTFFDEMNVFFKENYSVLAPVFIEMKKPPSELTV